MQSCFVLCSSKEICQYIKWKSFSQIMFLYKHVTNVFLWTDASRCASPFLVQEAINCRIFWMAHWQVRVVLSGCSHISNDILNHRDDSNNICWYYSSSWGHFGHRHTCWWVSWHGRTWLLKSISTWLMSMMFCPGRHMRNMMNKCLVVVWKREGCWKQLYADDTHNVCWSEQGLDRASILHGTSSQGTQSASRWKELGSCITMWSEQVQFPSLDMSQLLENQRQSPQLSS